MGVTHVIVIQAITGLIAQQSFTGSQTNASNPDADGNLQVGLLSGYVVNVTGMQNPLTINGQFNTFPLGGFIILTFNAGDYIDFGK